jgi:hypothetical protein
MKVCLKPLIDKFFCSQSRDTDDVTHEDILNEGLMAEELRSHGADVDGLIYKAYALRREAKEE